MKLRSSKQCRRSSLFSCVRKKALSNGGATHSYISFKGRAFEHEDLCNTKQNVHSLFLGFQCSTDHKRKKKLRRERGALVILMYSAL